MKKAVIVFLFLTAIAFISYAEDAPRISFPELSHDFGKVIQGKIVEYTFSFENKGTADLHIQEVTTSCGCTAALVSSNTLKPGETGQIKVSYDSQGRAGKVDRVITVVSNDPVEPSKELTISAMVDPSMHSSFNVNESLFSEKCSACHYIPAAGKQGKELYDAVCTFCHGKTAAGFDHLKTLPKEKMEQVIKNGIIGTEMPAWIKELKGPLDDEQIKSLISYIKGEPPL
ncbi:MAG: DUF1573 domain-containing protein [Nitrospirae bacterium]|nr:DUF1573 domain-containing protein [Nitrospirota bacterium]